MIITLDTKEYKIMLAGKKKRSNTEEKKWHHRDNYSMTNINFKIRI